MTYQMQAIPTKYAGVVFRSRLEARWAAFFDLCGWRWDYEPIDLAGWCPDFALNGAETVLIEVKPFDPAKLRQIKSFEDFQNSTGKQVVSCTNDIVLCGINPLFDGPGIRETPALGVHFEYDEYEYVEDGKRTIIGGYTEGFAEIDISCDPAIGRFDIRHDVMSYRHRLSGVYDGDHHINTANPCQIQELWRAASARVQWVAAHA